MGIMSRMDVIKVSVRRRLLKMQHYYNWTFVLTDEKTSYKLVLWIVQSCTFIQNEVLILIFVQY